MTKPSDITAVRDALNQGGVALLPTETVYGLAANAQSAAAMNKLYSLKGRDYSKPIALCVKAIATAKHLVEWSEAAEALTQHFWPGPLSLVMPAKDGLYLDQRLFGRYATGRRSLSLRCPDIDWRENLGVNFLALTSANRSGEPDSTDFETAHDLLGEYVDAAYHGEPSPLATPSTIIAIDEEERLSCLRWGALEPEDFVPLNLDWASQ